ncbi:fimbrillin family protein [Segatella copri]|uniref:Fimbrillin family protein n=1 Tax=Segatella copri TaxID=165179 RepID=A0AA92UM88_9BACT|nr:fimbrillin family protein [Segatella copri]
MKRNIYSYSKLWMILFVLMGTACTNQVEDAIPVSGQPIEFSVQSDWKEIHNTRSDDGKTQFVKDDQIQIFGFHTSPSGEVKKFMYDVKKTNYGQIVTYDGNSSWNYTPKRFWPKEGKLDFFASYPYNSIRNDADNHTMIYGQTANSMKQDLLWGVSTKNDCAAKNDVVITMKHALAKVNIFFDKSWGDIGTVMFSAYKAGRFTETDTDGIPKWIFNDGDRTPSPAVFGYNDLLRDDSGTSLTVFILPGNITGFQMFDVPQGNEDGKKIDGSDDISNELQQPQYKFLAGHKYNLKIRRAQKNTNSRSIAMSVRCVSE